MYSSIETNIIKISCFSINWIYCWVRKFRVVENFQAKHVWGLQIIFIFSLCLFWAYEFDFNSSEKVYYIMILGLQIKFSKKDTDRQSDFKRSLISKFLKLSNIGYFQLISSEQKRPHIPAINSFLSFFNYLSIFLFFLAPMNEINTGCSFISVPFLNLNFISPHLKCGWKCWIHIIRQFIIL